MIGLKYHYWHWLICFVFKAVPTQVCVCGLIRLSSDFYLDGSKPNVHLMMSKKFHIYEVSMKQPKSKMMLKVSEKAYIDI